MSDVPHLTLDAMAAYLNRLPFVRWDRLVDAQVDGQHMVDVYGWISRNDGRFDFVQINFVQWSETPGFSTSSSERSDEIATLLYGDNPTHFPCQRVEDVFGVERVPTAIEQR